MPMCCLVACTAQLCPLFCPCCTQFTLLDRNGALGFDLASKLLRQRDQFNRWGDSRGSFTGTFLSITCAKIWPRIVFFT